MRTKTVGLFAAFNSNKILDSNAFVNINIFPWSKKW